MASLALTPIKFRKTTSSSPLVPPKPTPMASLALTPIKFRKTTSSSPLVPPKPHQSSGSIHLPFLPRSASTFPHQLRLRAPINASSSSAPTGSSPGLYSSQTFELIAQNVDFVLEDVRPYLISDGGNVDVVSVEDGVVSLRLQGACESCPSSITTMQMGIERVLKEKFGDALKEIRQVYEDEVRETNAEAVNRHLDILRPAIANYGGSVEVLSVEGGECLVRYVGPESIGSGIKAAIKEKFPDIVNVALTC